MEKVIVRIAIANDIQAYMEDDKEHDKESLLTDFAWAVGEDIGWSRSMGGRYSSLGNLTVMQLAEILVRDYEIDQRDIEKGL